MFVKRNKGRFLVAALEQIVKERANLTSVARTQTAAGMRPITLASERYHDRVSTGPGALGAEGANGSSERDTLGVILPNTIFLVIWQALLMFTVDQSRRLARPPRLLTTFILHFYITHLASMCWISLRFPTST